VDFSALLFFKAVLTSLASLEVREHNSSERGVQDKRSIF